MKLKICGMKYEENITQVAALQPNYLGFIFYGKSARFFDNDITQLPNTIKKVGVFVNASIDYIIEKIKKHDLQTIQLHGKESPEFCLELKIQLCHSEQSEESHHEIPAFAGMTEIIKVFSVKDDFDFSVLKPYENVCDYYLFDTKGKLLGGNGYTFNWETLKDYPSTKPYFLSGGIGLNEIENIKSFLKTESSKYCYAIDVNSKFEIEAGLKNIDLLKQFKQNVITKDKRLK